MFIAVQQMCRFRTLFWKLTFYFTAHACETITDMQFQNEGRLSEAQFMQLTNAVPTIVLHQERQKKKKKHRLIIFS